MPASRRALLLSLVALAFLAVPAASFAVDELVLATEAEPEATDEQPSFPSGITPAEEAETGDGDEAEQPWTARFLAPLLLTIGVVGLVLSLLGYVVRLKARYRVLE